MKLLRILHAFIFIGIGFSGLNAQEATKWDVALPGRLSDGTPSLPAPKPAPIDFKVLSSRTTRMAVIEAAEMSDLPPITGTINVTVQRVEDPNLPEPPPPLPALPPDDPQVVARLAELRLKYRGTKMVFISASVHDHKRTLLRIYPNGKMDDEVSAWSNLDFNHFCGFSTYRVKDAVDGTFYDYGLLMGIGSMDTALWAALAKKRGFAYQAPEIPQMPDLSDGGPSFVLIEGDAKSAAMDTLEQIHDLYRVESAKMEQTYHARVKARAERKAFLLANPPKPEDIVIRFWERESISGR